MICNSDFCITKQVIKIMKMKILNSIFLLSLLLSVKAEKKNEDEKKEKKPEIGHVIGIDLGTTYSW